MPRLEMKLTGLNVLAISNCKPQLAQYLAMAGKYSRNMQNLKELTYPYSIKINMFLYEMDLVSG